MSDKHPLTKEFVVFAVAVAVIKRKSALNFKKKDVTFMNFSLL